MRKISLYMIITAILGLSIGRSIKNFRYRCYGVLNMLWSSRDAFRTYSVTMTKISFPASSAIAFACGTKENGNRFVQEFKKAFPDLYSRGDFALSVDGMWTFLPRGVGINLERYSPDNYGIRHIFKLLKISTNVADSVVAWTNRYWTNMLKTNYC